MGEGPRRSWEKTTDMIKIHCTPFSKKLIKSLLLNTKTK